MLTSVSVFNTVYVTASCPPARAGLWVVIVRLLPVVGVPPITAVVFPALFTPSVIVSVAPPLVELV
jgi:hypothetical protein